MRHYANKYDASSSITTQRGLLWKISMMYEITIQGNQTISVCERERERERERKRESAYRLQSISLFSISQLTKGTQYSRLVL